jgi:hypothetical protein
VHAWWNHVSQVSISKIIKQVQLAVHEVDRGKETTNGITVHKGSSKVLLPYDILTHNCVSKKQKAKIKTKISCTHFNTKY